MKDRLVSVDVLRGLTVAAMIIVNNPGSWEYIYPPLAHSEWHGCTPTDMVFPFFLFIVGASIHFSLSKSKSLSTQYRPIVIKILKRGAILFGLGLVLNAFPFIEFNHLRVMGVLQRISIVFVVTATLYLYLTRFQLYWVTVILLVFYWLFMCFVPIPGISNNLTPTGNMAARLDSFILKGHMWAHTKTWDPEGLTSTIPAISSALIGTLSAIWISSAHDSKKISIRMLLVALALICIGWIWGSVFPINKSLWTSSFVVYTSGFAMIFLAIFYYFLDIQKLKIPLGVALAFGSNAIVAYMFSELMAKVAYTFPISSLDGEPIYVQPWVFSRLVQLNISPVNASLLMAILWLVICSIPLWILYKRKIFIKV